MFKPFICEGATPNLPSYNFYIRIAAVKPTAPTSGITIPIPIHLLSNPNEIISFHAEQYGKNEEAPYESQLAVDIKLASKHQVLPE